MMRRLMKLINFFFFTVIVTILASCASAPQSDRLCPKIIVHTNESMDEFELNETEERLICGDPENPAYKVIPSYQASYMLTGLLQSRGYSQPRFEYVGDELHVYPEKKSYVKKIVVISDNPTDSEMVEKEMMRKFKKEIITPKVLDEIEHASITLLRNNTYPCSKLSPYLF